jgi:hypothetical protein
MDGGGTADDHGGGVGEGDGHGDAEFGVGAANLFGVGMEK